MDFLEEHSRQIHKLKQASKIFNHLSKLSNYVFMCLFVYECFEAN